MESGTYYCAEYIDSVHEDEDKEMSITKTVQFPDILSMVKWTKTLSSGQTITRKYKLSVERFSSIDEREFQIELERRPRKVISMVG